MHKKCLFLGYDEKKTKVIDFMKKKKVKVKKFLNQDLEIKDTIDMDLIVSFGYRKIISQSVLSQFKKPIINLHMSYLPYNRGSHPNFWSFIDNTPKGVTIHEVSNGIDDGNIIFQKKYDMDPSLEKFSTFKKTYSFLFEGLENLFIEKFDEIVSNSYSSKKQGDFFTFHRLSDLPSTFNDWDENIIDYLGKKNSI